MREEVVNSSLGRAKVGEDLINALQSVFQIDTLQLPESLRHLRGVSEPDLVLGVALV